MANFWNNKIYTSETKDKDCQDKRYKTRDFGFKILYIGLGWNF